MKMDVKIGTCKACGKMLSYWDGKYSVCYNCKYGDAKPVEAGWKLDSPNDENGWKMNSQEFDELSDDRDILIEKNKKLQREVKILQKTFNQAKEIIKLAEIAEQVKCDAKRLKELIRLYGEIEKDLDAATDKILSGAIRLSDNESIIEATSEGMFQ